MGKKTYRIAGLLFIGLILLLVIGRSGAAVIEKPQARGGILDLREWSFDEDGVVSLRGEYSFYWRRFVPPEAFSPAGGPVADNMAIVPDDWNRVKVEGQKVKGIGYATYYLKILLPAGHNPLSLKFFDMGTTFRVFANRSAVLTVGSPGTDAASSTPRYDPQVVDLEDVHDELDLIFHVSNFHHKKGGAWEPILLGLEPQIRGVRERNLLVDIFLFSSILIMGLYHIGLYFSRRSQRSFAYFGLFCLLIAIRTVTTHEVYLVTFLPWLDWNILVKIEYLAIYFAPATLALFVYSVYSEDFNAGILRTIITVGAVLVSGVLLLPVWIFSHTVVTFQIYTILSCVYGIYVLGRVSVKQREGSRLLLGGFILFFFTILNDILYYHHLINTGEFVPAGLFVFILSQAILIGYRFSQTLNTVERQSRELVLTNKKYSLEIRERLRAEIDLKQSREQLRQLSAHIESAREEERTWIARAIHDELGQVLSILKMDLSWLEKHVPLQFPAFGEKLHKMKALIQSTINQVRRISQMLRPSVLDNLGLSAAISWQCDEFTKHSEIQCHLDNRIEDLPLPQDQAIALFRVFQETLTNIIRHSNATEIDVSCYVDEGVVHLHVTDNGRGITSEEISNPASFGLTSMRERMRFLNGRFSIEGEPNTGTTLHVAVPVTLDDMETVQ